MEYTASIEKTKKYIKEHLSENLSAEKIAAFAGYSVFHFCRVFKRAMGMTPVQYQNECRLRIADILLKNGSLSISEIAGTVGFGDEAYFSRAYKKSRGVAPKETKSKLSK